MIGNGVRVVIASERFEVRHLLERMVANQGGVTVGQAPDAPKTMTLVTDFKPDVAIIDCSLPYVANEHTLPLSRVSGLDTAQRIARESPGTETVLLSNLDTIVIDHTGGPGAERAYSLKSAGDNTPLVIRNMGRSLVHSGRPVFANVEARPQEAPATDTMTVTDKMKLFGVLFMGIGGFLIVSWISALVGGALFLAGMTSVLLAMAASPTASLGRRLFGRKH